MAFVSGVDETSFDTPPPGATLIGPYARALREPGLKVGLFYSYSDWSRAAVQISGPG